MSQGLAKRLIPCLDVDKGRVVKGVQFVDIRDAGAIAMETQTGIPMAIAMETPTGIPTAIAMETPTGIPTAIAMETQTGIPMATEMEMATETDRF